MKRLVLALFVCASLGTRVAADETEVSFAYVPAPAVEKIVVDQPLGRLSVRGWDRPEVRITATKRAPNHAGLDRLRVRVDLKDGRLEIITDAGQHAVDAGRALTNAHIGEVVWS